ncbi:C40 family peptidase [Streptomyces sp. NPDC085995]|uniref:C40 family peptidase n=1 Tax=Streptomyces sp. NPDC085995 TaxID=3154861 RepID=UPI0034312C55
MQPVVGAAGGGGAQSATVAGLLGRLGQLYREAEQASERYDAAGVALERQRAEVARLDGALARARAALDGSRAAAGRLARQQYQDGGSGELSPYLRLLLARDPQHALQQGHVVGEIARERAGTVERLTGDEKRAAALARQAHAALDAQLDITRRQQRARDDVRARLAAVEKLLASLSSRQLAALAEFERTGIVEAQRRFLASGVLGAGQPPTAQGEEAVRYAVRQLGKPYRWGAAGPLAYDCSGLTSQAWARAGTPIPRTSQEQWARLKRVPLSELRPGDLVVYFPEATHVALYLGDGMVVQAPRPGAAVKVSPLAANPVLGAVRPDPGGTPLRRYVPPVLPRGALDGPDAGFYAAEPAAATSPR